MKVGYLHSGPAQHGIRRYSQLLATEARRRPDLAVIEADADLSGKRNRLLCYFSFGNKHYFLVFY